MVFMLSPDVRGLKGGISVLLISKKSGDRLDLLLPWGVELTEHLRGEKPPFTSGFTSIKDEL